MANDEMINAYCVPTTTRHGNLTQYCQNIG